jgi:hypothetical protein
MKNAALSTLTLTLILFLFGCASPHTITLTNGTVMQTKDKPKFNEREGFYKFKNDSGMKTSVNKDEVRKIEQANKQ